MGQRLGYTEIKGMELCLMIAMEGLAPKGIFEDEDLPVYIPRKTPYERHYDDWSRNCEDAA